MLTRRDFASMCAGFAALPLTGIRATQSAGERLEFVNACGAVGPIAGSRCFRYRVRAPGVSTIAVRLRMTPAAFGPVGWISLHSGGFGNGFFGDEGGGLILVRELSQRGFVVIDRAYGGQGWIHSGVGVRPQSRRGAVVLSFLANHAHAHGLPLIAIGNSGGAGELGYLTTTWPLGRMLPDRLVMCGGPPFSRLGNLCRTPSTPAWVARCAELTAGVPFTGQPQTSAAGGLFCSSYTGPMNAWNSILGPSAITVPLPRSSVLIGLDDTNAAVCQGLEFVDEVGVPHAFVPDAPHFMPDTAAGRAAIMAEVLAP